MSAQKQILLAVVFISIFGILLYFQSLNNSSSYIGGDFSIASTKGEYHLKDDRGRVVLLYFGFRFCPDVCPTTLSMLAKIYKELTPEEQNDLKLVFISVDVERDTLKSLEEYVSFFHKDFIGAIDTKAKIDSIALKYGVKYKKFFPKNTEEGFYTVDHSAQTFIINKKGEVANIIPYGEDQAVARDLIELELKEKI